MNQGLELPTGTIDYDQLIDSSRDLGDSGDLVYDIESGQWISADSNDGRRLLEFYIRSSGSNYESGYDSDPLLRSLEDSDADVTSEDWPYFQTNVSEPKVMEIYMDDKCAICLDPMIGEPKICLLECKHCFHKKCFETMDKAGIHQCPLCRTPFRFGSSSNSGSRKSRKRKSKKPKRKKRRFSKKSRRDRKRKSKKSRKRSRK